MFVKKLIDFQYNERILTRGMLPYAVELVYNLMKVSL
jgi:hypothetical protein